MKSNTELRQKSIRRVLSVIKNKAPISKRELQAITGFSWGNISSITTELLNSNYIIPSGKQETFVGRKPECFDINDNDNFIIGIDFSTKGVLAVLCDFRGRVAFKEEKQFGFCDKDEALDILYNLIDSILTANKDKNILHIAIAMQGDVDHESGVSLRIRKIRGWKNVQVCRLLEERYGIPTLMLHDPDCLLYAEKFFGTLSENVTNNALLLSITNHGIGIAALLGGKVYMGNKGKTCEIGNTVVPSFTENRFDLLQNIFSSSLVAEKYGKKDVNNAADVADLARKSDEKAIEIFRNIGNSLGFALNNASNLFNPEKIVLYGSFLNFSDLFLDNTKVLLTELMGEDVPEIVISEFDDAAAAIGASLFASDLVIKELEFA